MQSILTFTVRRRLPFKMLQHSFKFYNFQLGDAYQDYMLTVGQTPLAGNMTNPTVGEKNKKWEKDSNGRKFTTKDRDNDLNWELNCAQFRNFGYAENSSVRLTRVWSKFEYLLVA